MLQACCDCIFGSPTSDSVNNLDEIRLNGNSTHGTKMSSNNDMFLIPRKLDSEDYILISGTVTKNPNSLSIHLIKENNQNSEDNWSLVANFNENNVSVVENGKSRLIEGVKAKELLNNVPDVNKFELKLINFDNRFLHIISINNYYTIGEFEKNLNDIDSVAVDGAVEHVDRVLYQYRFPIYGMLPITRSLNSDTKNVITLSGTVKPPNSLYIALEFDEVIVCQVDADFNKDQLNIKPVEDVDAGIEASELIADSNLSLTFVFDENYIKINSKNRSITQVTSAHNTEDIKHIIIKGDECITTLDFKFDT